MKWAAKLIKDRLAELGIPRREVIARVGVGGVGFGHSFDPSHRDTIIENAEQLAATGDLGVVIGRYDPCGCVYKTMVTTDSRHRGKVTRLSMPGDLGHECATEVAV